MNMRIVAVLVVLLCLVFALGLSDPRIFAALPESIIGAGVAVAWFLVVLLILAGLWRLVNRVISGASATIHSRTAPDAGQRLPSVHRLNGWQRIGIVLTACWFVGVACLATLALVNDKHPPSIGVIAGW